MFAYCSDFFALGSAFGSVVFFGVFPLPLNTSAIPSMIAMITKTPDVIPKVRTLLCVEASWLFKSEIVAFFCKA